MEVATSPQHAAVGEDQQSYASKINRQKILPTLDLCPISMEQGIPTVEFSVDEVNTFTREEGLHQAVIFKFSYGKPDLQDLRRIFPKYFDVKGTCNIGQLEYRHILVRLDLFEDFANVISKTSGFIKSKGEDFFFRTFLWTMDFNPREETYKAVTWISFPELPANFFAKKSLMSIASIVGKPIAIDKATQDRTRPSTARVKILINLLDNHPKKVKIKIVDKKSGRIVEYEQRVVFDNLPKYCTCCHHQGHDVVSCRWNSEKVIQVEPKKQDMLGKLIGDARVFLNAKNASRRMEEGLPRVAAVPTLSESEMQITKAKEKVVQAIKMHKNSVWKIVVREDNADGSNDSHEADPGHSKEEVVNMEHRPHIHAKDVTSNANVMLPDIDGHSATELATVASTVISGNKEISVLKDDRANNSVKEMPAEVDCQQPEKEISTLQVMAADNSLVPSDLAFNSTKEMNAAIDSQQTESGLVIPIQNNQPTDKGTTLISSDHITGNAVGILPDIDGHLTKEVSTLLDPVASTVISRDKDNNSAKDMTAIVDCQQESGLAIPLNNEPTDSAQCGNMVHDPSQIKDRGDLIQSARNVVIPAEDIQGLTADNAQTFSLIQKEASDTTTVQLKIEEDHDSNLVTVEGQARLMVDSAQISLPAANSNQLVEKTGQQVHTLAYDTIPNIQSGGMQGGTSNEQNAGIEGYDQVKASEEAHYDQKHTADTVELMTGHNLIVSSEQISGSGIKTFDKSATASVESNVRSPSIHPAHSHTNSDAKTAVHISGTKYTPSIPKRSKVVKLKVWNDQRDYDDEETWGDGLASLSWEEEDQEGDQEDSDDSVEQICQNKNAKMNQRANIKQSASPKKGLNHNAPFFVPKKQRDSSWYSKECEDVILRKLPMRNAKQKQAVQPSILKPTRLRSKREG